MTARRYDLLMPCPVCKRMQAMADPGHKVCRRCEGTETLAARGHRVPRPPDAPSWEDTYGR